MAAAGSQRASGDGPETTVDGVCMDVPAAIRETTALLSESGKMDYASNVQSGGLYQSLSAGRVEESDEERRQNVIGPPQSNEDGREEMEVVIEVDDQAMAEERTNDLQCLMHILKGNIGTGVLAMGKAVSHSGLWTGVVGILFIGMVATHCMHLLVKSSKLLSKRSVGMDKLGYAEVMELSLKTGPPRLRWLAPHARLFVNALLLFTQYGFCCVYIVFIATSIKDVVEATYPNSPDLRVYELATSFVLALYCMIKDLRTLAPFSFFANILTLAGMFLIFLNITQGLPDVTQRPAFSNFKDLPLFFGTVIFAFEGISLVLPLESSMKDRERFSGLSGVLNLSMVCVTCLYTAIGFYGYLKFGDEVSGSITLNLPSSPWYYLIVKPMFAITIFVSYNVQMYVPIHIIAPWVAHKMGKESVRQKNVIEYVTRILSVIVTMGFAMAIPHLDLLIALIGALASSSLAMILPAFIHILIMLTEPERPSPIIIIKDILITILGVLGFVTGTYTSLKEIVATF